ncbi:MAG: ABC transporter ATP-binding protein [Proteobacteria bacterium]|nr:ABC transporter ATP-binding protein [Pseudomonadota bacterium]
MTPALSTQGISVHFGAFRAVDNVNLNVRPGARHALIGPNGAGKTALVHALTGSLSPTAGTIQVFGEEVSSRAEKDRVRRGLARTFQINQLFRGLSVLDNVVLAIMERDRKTAAFWRSVANDKRAHEAAREHLAFVNLTQHADREVRHLPYGSQRLLEIAIALATRPRILVLDEPAAGVPSGESHAIFERIHALPQDLTLLFIEHDMGLVFRFSDRISVLVAGQILIEGAPSEISSDERVKEIYLGRRAGHAA